MALDGPAAGLAGGGPVSPRGLARPAGLPRSRLFGPLGVALGLGVGAGGASLLTMPLSCPPDGSLDWSRPSTSRNCALCRSSIAMRSFSSFRSCPMVVICPFWLWSCASCPANWSFCSPTTLCSSPSRVSARLCVWRRAASSASSAWFCCHRLQPGQPGQHEDQQPPGQQRQRQAHPLRRLAPRQEQKEGRPAPRRTGRGGRVPPPAHASAAIRCSAPVHAYYVHLPDAHTSTARSPLVNG